MPLTTAPHYLVHAAIDRQRWDDSICRAANSLPYAYSWYLDVVSPQWDALVTADYSAVMPLTWKRKWGISYLHQPFFTQQLGVFSLVPPTEHTISVFLAAIPSRFKYLDFYLNYANFCPISPTFTTHCRTNYVLSLNDTYEQLHLGYRPNARGSLKKACRSPLPVVTDIAPELVVQLFQSATGAKIDNLGNEQYQLLTRLTRACSTHNMAQTYGIYDENHQLSAAIFLIKTPKRLVHLVSAGNTEARRNNLMFKVIDKVIQQYARTDILLDFEGSMIDTIAAFYRGFGAKETYYWHVLKNQMPHYLRWLKRNCLLDL